MTVREKQDALAKDLQKVWREYQEYLANPDAYEKTEFPEIAPYKPSEWAKEKTREIFEWQKQMSEIEFNINLD
jgi:hypothetical protein